MKGGKKGKKKRKMEKKLEVNSYSAPSRGYPSRPGIFPPVDKTYINICQEKRKDSLKKKKRKERAVPDKCSQDDSVSWGIFGVGTSN